MRNARLLSGGLIFALGMSGTQAAVQAQSSYRPVVRPPTPSTPVITASSTSKSANNSPPLSGIEMQIELAWLADPVTFPFDLKARTKDGQLRVFGNVANQSVRDRALLIAGQFASVQVVDKMHIQANAAPKAATVSAAELQQAVSETISKDIGPSSNSFEIKAHTSGQVSIAGDVATLESKLAVSKSLRGVKGCVCVVNLLNVTEPTSPTRTALKDAPRSIQDRVTSLFSRDSSKKDANAELTTASTWKQAPLAKQQAASTQTKTPATAAFPSISPAPEERSKPSKSSIQTVGLKENTGKAASSTAELPLDIIQQEKTTNIDTEPLPVELEPKGSAPKTGARTLSSDPLKLEIEKICGKSAHHVQVSIMPDKSVTISLECKNKSEAERLSKQILHLKSLAPFEVGLDISFEP